MTQTPRDIRQVLAGKAQCLSCDTPMLRLGPNYACPTRANPNSSSCPDNTINADRLLRLVATQVVEAVMTNSVMEKVAARIEKEADDTSERLQKHLDQTENALYELNQRETDLYIRESVADYTVNFADELHDIANKRVALSYEARNSRREIDAQEFISDEDRIAENATDVDTYLDHASPETTYEFIDIFVKSLRVEPSSIELTYMFPIPSEEYPKGRITDVIPRSDSG